MGNTPSRHHGPAQEKKTVFLSKEKVYRIPALFYDNDKKVFMAFAEQRKTTDDASSEMLVMKTGTMKTPDLGMIEWSDLRLVKEAHLAGYRPMNPCPVYEKTTKTLFLFFICVKGTVSECWQRFWGCNQARLCYITTTDAGQSWSGVTDLTDKLGEIKNWATFAVGPGHGLQTENGRLIVPLYGYAPCSGSFIMFYCTIPHALYLYSDDKGKNWQFSSMLQTKSVECEMAEVLDDTGLRSIYCNARSEGGFRVEALDKGDGLMTLPPAKKLVETGRGCQGSVVSFPAQGEAANTKVNPSQNPNKWLVYTHPTDQSKRINLGVYLNKSPQDPNAWSEPSIINSGPSGYSDLAYIGDGWFACLMECGEQKETEQIAYVVFNYKQIKPCNGGLKK